jgi:OFA family oxalate/formate antiporter-like MFS transporter
MTTNRWLIALAGVLMQIALGAVYAWSVFRNPLIKAHGWTIPDVTLIFQITILVVGFAAFLGGLWMKKAGPRPVALTAAILYGAGTAAAGLAQSLPMLYLTYGFIAGTGLGLGYIVPVATLIKWFPDRRGMITGIAVAGFGAGALVMAPVATSLIKSVGVGTTFELLGLAYLVIVLACAFAMRNPPEGYAPPGYQAPPVSKSSSGSNYTLSQALRTWQWYALWLTLFLNANAGIAIISQASPMAQEISHVSAAVAAGMVSLISIGNSAGRFLWAWLSDAIGRRNVFLTMFLLQAVLFFLLSRVESFGLLTSIAFVVLLCYGGGFGTMPAFAADYFGAKDVGSIYGMMLTAWGLAGMFGPTIFAQVRQATGRYQGAMTILAIVILVSAVVPLILRPPKALA